MPKILLTRPRTQSEALAREVADRGWDSMIWPLIDIRPLLTTPPDWADAAAFVFTSANGVRAINALAHPDVPAFCVGAATTKAARTSGFRKVENAAGDAAALARLIAARQDPAAGPLIHVRGRDVTGDLSGELMSGGFAVCEVIAYEAAQTGPPPPEIEQGINQGTFDAVAFFSPRSSAIFSDIAGDRWKTGLAKTAAIAISPAAAVPLENTGFKIIMVATTPSGESMRSAICNLTQTSRVARA